MSEEPEFYRVTEGGRVHVLDRFILNPTMVGVAGAEDNPLAALFHWWVARCGRKDPMYPPNGTIGWFPDSNLCIRCWRATPEDERHALFEHAIDEEGYGF